MSNRNYVIGMGKPTGGDIVQDNKRTKIERIVPSSSKQEWRGTRSKDKQMRI